MKKFLPVLLATATFFVKAQQQNTNEHGHPPCKTHSHDQEIFMQHGVNPATHPDVQAYEQWMKDFAANNSGQRGGVYIIPIVFHIAHVGGMENISDAQIYDAINVLNRDFRKLNADTSLVVAQFKSIVADCEIEFRLAQKDALGNCVSGITRTFTTETLVGEQEMVDDINYNLNNGTSTNNLRFPRDKYLNVWVCANPSGAAGYTNTPIGAAFQPSKYDGIWISHAYTGSIGTSSVVTSRTLTHEVGHWLNLSHVWGNSNNPGVTCGDDNVPDTPETMGWSTCNLSGATCGNPIDNVQNYMEYSYCSRMFTEGQKTRMQAALNSFVSQRDNLSTAANLTLTGTDGPNYLCAAEFTGNKLILCPGDSVQFSDMSYHGVNGWNWSFSGGAPSSSTLQNPMVTYNTPGTYDVTLTATDGSGNVAQTKTGYITVLPATGVTTPYFEMFETMTNFPNGEFFVENPDGGPGWELYAGAGSSGNQCLKLNNFANQNDNTKDAFISSTIDLSPFPSVTFSFWAAYARKISTNNDILRVMVSNNCGQSWSTKKTLSANSMFTVSPTTSAFTPASIWEWQLHYVTGLTGFMVPNFRYKFELQSDLGNNLYIDDIYIHGPESVGEVGNSGYSFTMMPNPVETEVAVTLTAPGDDNVTIQLTDMAGRVIFENKNAQAVSGMNIYYIPTAELSSGMYMVHVFSDKMKMSNKLVRK
jgi:PKD repeat protein